MNVTLSLDNAVVDRARRKAQTRGMTLNQVLRDFLDRYTADADVEQAVAELERLWQEHPGDACGWRFNRQELYDRPVLR